MIAWNLVDFQPGRTHPAQCRIHGACLFVGDHHNFAVIRPRPVAPDRQTVGLLSSSYLFGLPCCDIDVCLLKPLVPVKTDVSSKPRSEVRIKPRPPCTRAKEREQTNWFVLKAQLPGRFIGHRRAKALADEEVRTVWFDGHDVLNVSGG